MLQRLWQLWQARPPSSLTLDQIELEAASTIAHALDIGHELVQVRLEEGR
jgi:hypothetical protein